ncbi:tRNA pseudouridine(55) synthase TruB [Corynebacterium ulceribovis]|uniref:tRNA pseudouridine(55) synthase TruB n=1 Tax=Corynebacterium ulceribovis TaxID=487732 RepID=UPI0003633A63|nr:tRNA pseudouridine(55) synthase TruB [Corynebacterium ulceribovis]
MSDPIADSGLVIVDKPAGMTSHDVVSRLRHAFGTRKVGHAGTLDPMATGVLVVGINRGTRFLPHLVADTKSYAATIRLGAATTTDDAEGEVVSSSSAASVTEDQVLAAIAALTGDIMQVPSAVSAVKIDGKRAYQRVRDGETVEIPARPVTITRFDLLDFRPGELCDVDVEVDCSSGTYIRALARDIGQALGCGGHLTALRRTASGSFTLADAQELEALMARPGEAELSVSLDDALKRCYPVRDITEAEGTGLALGKWLGPIGLKGVHAAVTPDGKAIALIEESGKRAASVFVARPAGL